jgi:hypothetical protein
MKLRWIIYVLILVFLPFGVLYMIYKDTPVHDSMVCACAGDVDCSKHEDHECCPNVDREKTGNLNEP